MKPLSRLVQLKSLLFKIFAMVFITLALFEIVLRVYHRVHPVFIFSGNTYDQYRPTPLYFHHGFPLNSRGYRDEEFRIEKPATGRRIIAIGDSFVFGATPYPYNFVTILEKELNKNREPVEIINMGIPGLHPGHYLSLLVNEGLELNPDQVIIGFFIGNDFDPYVEPERGIILDNSYLAAFSRFIWDAKNTWKAASKRLLNFKNIVNAITVYNDDLPLFDPKTYLELVKRKSWVFRVDSPGFEDHFKRSVSYLKKISSICQQKGLDLLVVVMPDEVQVDIELQKQMMKALALGEKDFDFSRPNRLLTQWLADENIDHIDLLDDFTSVSKEKRFYRLRDTHWNIGGNYLAAKSILDHMTRKR